MLFEADYAKNYASIMYQCLTAGSNEKTQRSPAGNQTQGLANCGFVAQWLERATRIRKTLGSIPGGAALCFFV